MPLNLLIYINIFRKCPASTSIVLFGLVGAALSFALDVLVLQLGWHHDRRFDVPWQFLTAHFVHLNAAHLAVNFIAAVLFGLICDRLKLSRQLLVASLLAMVWVDLGLEFGPWHIDWYVGLSGVLHGIFAWLCLSLLLRPAQGHWWGQRGVVAVFFLGGLLKVLVSLSVPVGSLGWQEIPQVTPAHLYGFAGGTFWALLRWPK